VTSPTKRLPSIDKARAVARGLVVYSPPETDLLMEHFFLQREQGTACTPGWTLYLLPNGREWYVYDSGDGRGSSGSALPAGEVLAATVELPGNRPMTLWLQDRTRELESGARQPGRPLRPDDFDRLWLALAACVDGHGDEWLAARRAEMDDQYELLRRLAYDDPPAEGWLFHLQALRSAYGVDGVTTGAFATAVELVHAVLDACPEDARVETGARYWSEFHSALSANANSLLEILARRALADGHDALVSKLVDELRDRADALIEVGLDSPTLDEHLEALYVAVPTLHGALMLARVLVDVVGDRRTKQVERATDEKLVRVGFAFTTQLQDLEGDRWNGHQARIAQLRAEEGADEADAFAEGLVEREFLYPRAILGELLDVGALATS
jgi:hypothetical protein